MTVNLPPEDQPPEDPDSTGGMVETPFGTYAKYPTTYADSEDFVMKEPEPGDGVVTWTGKVAHVVYVGGVGTLDALTQAVLGFLLEGSAPWDDLPEDYEIDMYINCPHHSGGHMTTLMVGLIRLTDPRMN